MRGGGAGGDGDGGFAEVKGLGEQVDDGEVGLASLCWGGDADFERVAEPAGDFVAEGAGDGCDFECPSRRCGGRVMGRGFGHRGRG